MIDLHKNTVIYDKDNSTFDKSRKKHAQKSGIWKRYKKLWLALIFTPIILSLVSGGWVAYKIFKNSSDSAGGNAFGFLVASKLKGEDRGRVNILLAGNSSDDEGHSGANLTDSMMLISINVVDNSAYMLSIPRDFYVDIPGYGYNKLNATYVYGERDDYSASGKPSGGIGLLQQTIEETFGISVDHYAVINYSAFKDSVNAVGGIDVNINSSDPRGIFDPNINIYEGGPLKLTNGWNHLDGQTALNLARARNDPPPDGRRPYGLPRGDFNRTENQRMMLLALAEKAKSLGVVANPVKVGELLDSMGRNVRTDMKTSQIRRLYDLFGAIGAGNIQSLSLSDPDNGVNLLKSYRTPQGSSTLIPTAGIGEYDDIQEFIEKANNPEATPSTQ